MFWDKWIPSRFLKKTSVCGVEAVITTEGICFYYAVLKIQKGQLSISHSGNSKQQEDLPAFVTKDKIPVVINISGKGIITKKINLESGENVQQEEIIAEHLPTINQNDFYIQINHLSACAFISIIRKEDIDNILNSPSLQNKEIVDIIIGPSYIETIGPIVSKFNLIQSNCYKIDFSNNAIDTISPLSDTDKIFTYDIDGLEIKHTHLMTFAVGFNYLTEGAEITNSNTKFEELKNKHSEKNKLRVVSYSYIGFAAIICLINFLFFNYYFGLNNKLDTELNIYQDKYDQINDLLSNYEKKKQLIDQAGVMSGYPIAKFADKIAGTIPKEVVLIEWVFNPMKKNAEEDSLLCFEKNNISIKGNCNKSLIINEWLNVLKSQNFIQDVNLEKFNFNTESNLPNFEINIIIK